MSQLTEMVVTTIGGLIMAGGGGAAIAFALFKVFGEKWLNAKFEERLAEYKHAQQKEIEQLRFRINALMDRTTKLHQREFDVLPEAWSRLNDAFGQTTAFVSSLQSYPDLNRMTDDHLNEFLKNTPLGDWEKAELIAETDRTQYFIKRIFWHRLSDAREACREHHAYLKKNGIFIPVEVRDKFYELDTLIWDALTEHELNEQMQQVPRMQDKIKALTQKGPQAARGPGAKSSGETLELSIYRGVKPDIRSHSLSSSGNRAILTAIRRALSRCSIDNASRAPTRE